MYLLITTQLKLGGFVEAEPFSSCLVEAVMESHVLSLLGMPAVVFLINFPQFFSLFAFPKLTIYFFPISSGKICFSSPSSSIYFSSGGVSCLAMCACMSFSRFDLRFSPRPKASMLPWFHFASASDFLSPESSFCTSFLVFQMEQCL